MTSEKFDRGARLRSRHEFVAVQQGGRRVSARYVTLVGRPNDRGRDRLGIIATRRLGGAVERNQAKRRLRELFRKLHSGDAAPPQPPLDVVAIARRELIDASFAAAKADFQAALRKLRGSR